MSRYPQYRMMGDAALLIELGNRINKDVNQQVQRLFLALRKNTPDSLLDIVPAYGSLLLIFNPFKTTAEKLKQKTNELFHHIDYFSIPDPAVFEIPVVYGGRYGPDMPWVCQYHGLSFEDVVRLHTRTTYHVFMIGFSPGFPYMGELPRALETPRKRTPRTAVPKGSVGLALKQTGIYPSRSPGGWQIIGRTPLELFNPSKDPPTLLQMGDQVRFLSISKAEMEHWKSSEPFRH